MHMAVSKRWTVDDVRDLPSDGNRYEIIDGNLVVTPAPSWSHQDAVGLLYSRIAAYLAAHPVGHVLFAPADVVFADNTVVEPDVFVVPLVGGRKPHSWEQVGRLLLVVEVLSPSSARTDRVDKRDLYKREAVTEYWIVDVDAGVVERWRPEDERPEILSDRLTWQPDAAHPPLVVVLPEFFAEVVGT